MVIYYYEVHYMVDIPIDVRNRHIGKLVLQCSFYIIGFDTLVKAYNVGLKEEFIFCVRCYSISDANALPIGKYHICVEARMIKNCII